MKHKVSELEGEHLNAAVAKAEGWALHDRGDWRAPPTPDDDQGALMASVGYWEPSSAWDHGGPIIERERIAVFRVGDDEWQQRVGYWMAGYCPTASEGRECDSGWLELPKIEVNHEGIGGTALIAAMRAYVASKFGEEIELP